MARTPESRLWEDVREGERLPPLEVPVTFRTAVLAVAGMRDFNPVHHYPDYARRAAGNTDAWMNTMWHQGIFARFATDWLGPDSDFRSTWLHMTGFIHPGDTVTVEGEVARRREAGGERRAELVISARTQRGRVARAGAELALPSRAGGAAAVRADFEKPAVEPDPELPDFAQPWIGRQTEPLWGGYPVSEAQIMYWADMAEDANPLYEDGAYARASRHGGMIAPFPSLFTWTMGRPGHFGEPFGRPDPDDGRVRPWPPSRETGDGRRLGSRLITNLLAGDWTPPGATRYAAQRVRQDYGPPLRPGDWIYTRSEVADCTPRKRTRLGEGHFLTLLTSFYRAASRDRADAAADALVAASRYTFFFYDAAEGAAAPAR